MKIDTKHIKEIKSRFATIKSKQDIINEINFVNELLYGEYCEYLTEKSFNYYANPEVSKNRYTTFSVKKKNGGERVIHAPVNGLKHILRPLNIIFNAVAEPHFKATGFVPGKSIVDNAKQHVGKHYVYNIDLKDFFHSFDRNRVKLGLMYAPFNLSGELEPLAFLLSSLCTHPFEIDGSSMTVLPQGAPTSPTITNILCVTLDRRLNGLAKRFNISYSRYADDISFSSQTNVFDKKEFLKELHRIIKDQNFEINTQKTRLQKSGFKQEVTGLIVNQKVNVNSKYIKQLRMWLYYWEKYGYTKAEQIFRRDYVIDKGHVKKGTPNLKNVLHGKLEYLKMVKGSADSTYIKLMERFKSLDSKNSRLDAFLLSWEENFFLLAYGFMYPEKSIEDMSKWKLIKGMLETEKFNSHQKQRFVRLITKELEEYDLSEEALWNEIDIIKNKLNLANLDHKEGVEIYNNKVHIDIEGSVDQDEGDIVETRVANIFDDNSTNNVTADQRKINYQQNEEKESNKLKLDKIELVKDSHSDLNNENLGELPKYYYPVSLYRFLYKYNQNKILKSTCHDIDSNELEIINRYCNTKEYDFNIHLNKIIEAYEIHEKTYFAPTNLKTLFRVYLTGENYRGEQRDGWTTDSIKINWSCAEIKKWSEENPGIPPSPSDGVIEQFENTGYEFPTIESKLTGQNIQSFSQLVIHFKHLFHFRSDNSLRSIIERKNLIEGWNEKINFIINDEIFPSNVEHFTDIDKLVQAYKRIILIILEVVDKHGLEKPQIKLSIGVDLEKFYFSIHHINSVYKKTFPNTIERLGQSYRNLILNQINGLCEFYLKADFGQNFCAQINLWNGIDRLGFEIDNMNFKGVEHLFVFPKK